MRVSSIISVSFAVGALASKWQLPPLSGPFPVGTVSLELVDYSRSDPLAPEPKDNRDLMVSLFYPTDITTPGHGNFSFAPAFSPSAAQLFDIQAVVPNGTSANIISRSYLNAPLVDNELPILVFGHGLGGSRLIYSSQLEELASHGWIIVDVDHTYDALGVEFPDGRVVHTNVPADADLEYLELLLETRVADVKFVVDSLGDSATLKRIPGLEDGDTQLNTDAVGIFGHSFGGATAAQAMANYSTFSCGANFDGTLFGSVAASGLEKPFVLMAAENHTRTLDPSWAEFWENSDGFKREYNVNGTIHESFEDVSIYRDLLGDNFPSKTERFGTFPGGRLLRIETELMNAFFGFCMKGQHAGRLDRLVEYKFPEVSDIP
ncbi:hypothetical protein SLS64_007444 [Diaporthe eres]|uniref:1-alkyl-2-acetylglycerophosphocholine esterase n=1 Tax=Diaporthe eres TaxID=83184 RepID=A0ABR1NN41_DIAER